MKRLAAVYGCLIAGIAGAIEYKWQHPVSGEGYWEDANNWLKQDAGVGVDLPGPSDWALFDWDWNSGNPQDTTVRSAAGGEAGEISIRESMRTVTFDLTPGAVLDTVNFNVWGRWEASDDSIWNAAVVKGGTICARAHITAGTWQRSCASLTATGPDTVLMTVDYDISTEGGGFGNSIIISNQAQVISARGFGVGSNHPGDPGTGSHCRALVSGEGTYVQTGGGCVLVGYKGADNQLIVEKGAVVAPTVRDNSWPSGVHIGKCEGSDRNLILVREGGAITNASCPWSIIGGSGSHNRLCITDTDSRVVLGAVCIGGDNYGGSPYGTNNVIEVLDGGSLTVNNLTVGGSAGSDYNRLIVDNATVTSEYEVKLGLRGSTNFIDIRNQGKFGSLSRYLYLGGADGGPTHGNVCTVSGEGSEIATAAQGFIIGADGCTGNELHICDGAEVGGTGQMALGHGVGAANNRVLITSGGKCCVFWSINIGNAQDANGNEIYIGGEGSKLATTEYDVTLGECGHSNRIVVADGGLLRVTRGLYIGGFPGNDQSRPICSSNNVLRVENGRVETPNGSGWSGTSSFLVRNEGRVEIAGTNSCIEATRFEIDGSSALCFELGESVPVQTPLVLNLPDDWPNYLVIDGATRLEIDAERLMRNGGCRGFTLIATGLIAAPALSNLVNNAAFVSGEGSVYLNEEKTALLLNVRSRKATVLIVK